MTLKQFFQLAGGFVVALIFYSTPIIGIIKWPFVILSALLGVALAFLPLEERPLEKWIFAFFRAIYAPTEFAWKKTTAPKSFFQAEANQAETATPQQNQLNQYLASTFTPTGSSAKLEGREKGFLAGLTGIVSGLVTQATGGPVVQNIPTTQPTNMQTGSSASLRNQSQAQNQTQPDLGKTISKKDIQIPETAPIRVVKPVPSHLVVEEKTATPQGTQITTHQVSPTIAGEEIVSTKQAIFSPEAAPPNPPTIPNVVVGQVVDANRKIVEGAIMEIRDSAGRPVRALRSNKVGHFITVTPLDNGRYDIVTEKEGYEFSPISFEAQGQIIPPILVEGKIVNSTQNAEYGTAEQKNSAQNTVNRTQNTVQTQ